MPAAGAMIEKQRFIFSVLLTGRSTGRRKADKRKAEISGEKMDADLFRGIGKRVKRHQSG